MKTKQRNYKLDNLRALAILLVVFGHSIILYSSAWNSYVTSRDVPVLDLTKAWINLIQMPLFFALSGYLYAWGYKRDTLKMLCIKKAKRLLIPYLLAAFLWMVPVKLLAHYPGYAGKTILDIGINGILKGNENGHLWFLPCLFFCFLSGKVICSFLDRLETKRRAIEGLIWIAALLLSMASEKLTQILYIRHFFSFFVWFYTGFLMNREFGRMRKKRWMKWTLTALSFVGSVLALLFPGRLHIFTMLILLVTAFMIIPNRHCKAADFFSKNSFGIYLFHSPLIYITFACGAEWNPGIVILINFVLWGGAACLLTLLIRRTPLKIMIGE